MLEDAINEQIFEFAHLVQRMIKNGWTFGKINYGERRLGISPSITISKDDKVVQCYSISDIETELEKTN